MTEPIDTTLLTQLQQFGQFLGGIGLILAGGTAFVTLLTYQRRAAEHQWLESFRSVYAEFWNNRQSAQARLWIASDEAYKDLETVLMERLASTDNLLDTGDENFEKNRKLETLDFFLSVCVRVNSLGQNTPAKHKGLWRRVFHDFWFRKMAERTALKEYAERYWPEVI